MQHEETEWTGEEIKEQSAWILASESWKSPMVPQHQSGVGHCPRKSTIPQADLLIQTTYWVTMNPPKGFHFLNIFFPTYFLLVVITQVFPKSEAP